MKPIAKQILAEATASETYWNLSDAERIVWLIERAFARGLGSRSPGVPRRTPRRGKRKFPSTGRNKEKP